MLHKFAQIQKRLGSHKDRNVVRNHTRISLNSCSETSCVNDYRICLEYVLSTTNILLREQ